MSCGCKKQPVVTTPTPVIEIKREDYPDTPEGQHAYELALWHKEQKDNNT